MTAAAVERVAALADAVAPSVAHAHQAAQARHARLAKPPGSLGRLEGLAAQLAGTAGCCPPPVPSQPVALIGVADHGIHARGVSPWPQTLTAAMANHLAAGTASIGAIARSIGVDWRALDVGCVTPASPHPRLISARVRPGTADWSRGPAMRREEAAEAVLAGAAAADALVSEGADLLLHGDMGLANTTTAAALLAALTGHHGRDVAGPGTDPDPDAVGRKADLIDAAITWHRPDPHDPLGVLSAVGGLEHAALAGATLACAARRVPVVLDGVSSVAAALAAARLAPATTDHVIAGHRSPEPGAQVGLDALGLRALLDLELRLGEGTGGVLAVPLIVGAAAALRDTVTLDEATM